MCNGFLGAGVAQLVEQRTRNAQVLGSIPSASSKFYKQLRVSAFSLKTPILQFYDTLEPPVYLNQGCLGGLPISGEGPVWVTGWGYSTQLRFG